MKPTSTAPPHKLGANKGEPAKNAVKHDPNFKQSRDIREDRSQRQAKSAASAKKGK